MLPSWRLKLLRAQKHLTDLYGLLSVDTDRRPHPIRESFEPDNNDGPGPYWYRVGIDFAPDEMVPSVAGDFLFNVRSALDHLAVALVPTNRKRKASFPIFTKDPLKTNDATGDYLDPESARGWLRMTKGMKADALAAVTSLQPYERGRIDRNKPTDHWLAILSELQNADKHRDLVVVGTGIGQSKVTIESEPEPWYLVPKFPDGAPLYDSPTQVDVQLVGAICISFGVRMESLREFPRVFEGMVAHMGYEVLPLLEPFVPASPDWTPLIAP